MKLAIFLIESGCALGLVRQHLVELKRVMAENRAIAEELGVSCILTDRDSGAIMAVDFASKPVHPEFTVARRRCSRPKKATSWARRFAAVEGYRNPDERIVEAFGIPHHIDYGIEGSIGSRLIGYPFSACSFLYLGEEGPYAMCVPDIEAEVRNDEARGMVVSEPAKSFRMQFEGCRRISQAEWDLLVAKHCPQDRMERLAA